MPNPAFDPANSTRSPRDGLPDARVLSAIRSYGAFDGERRVVLGEFLPVELLDVPHAITLVDATPCMQAVETGGLAVGDALDVLGRAARAPWPRVWVEADTRTGGSWDGELVREAAYVDDRDRTLVMHLFCLTPHRLIATYWAEAEVTFTALGETTFRHRLTPVGEAYLRSARAADAARQGADPEYLSSGEYVQGYLKQALVPLGLALCRNADLEPLPTGARATGGGRRSRRQRPAQLKLRTLMIGGRSLRSHMHEIGHAASGEGVAFHLVRGHIKTYTHEQPLFGRHVGAWFWLPHLRGSTRYGEIVKTYEV